jgi:hypothetical protein
MTLPLLWRGLGEATDKKIRNLTTFLLAHQLTSRTELKNRR